MGRLTGWLLWISHSRARRTTETNIRACFPSLPACDQKKLAKDSLCQSATTLFEMPSSWLWPASKTLGLIQRVEGEDMIRQALAEKRGVIVIAPHLGNWEVLGLYLATLGPVTSLYQPPKSESLDKLIYQARQRNGAELVPTNRKGVSSLLKTLKQGGMTGILPDQEPDPQSGVFVPFFSVPALTMTLLANLVTKTRPLVVSGWAKRSSRPAGYEILFSKVDDAIYSEDLETQVIAMNQAVEACVRIDPPQYQWEYKRFKKQPGNPAGKFY